MSEKPQRFIVIDIFTGKPIGYNEATDDFNLLNTESLIRVTDQGDGIKAAELVGENATMASAVTAYLSEALKNDTDGVIDAGFKIIERRTIEMKADIDKSTH